MGIKRVCVCYSVSEEERETHVKSLILFLTQTVGTVLLLPNLANKYRTVVALVVVVVVEKIIVGFIYCIVLSYIIYTFYLFIEICNRQFVHKSSSSCCVAVLRKACLRGYGCFV